MINNSSKELKTKEKTNRTLAHRSTLFKNFLNANRLLRSNNRTAGALWFTLFFLLRLKKSHEKRTLLSNDGATREETAPDTFTGHFCTTIRSISRTDNEGVVGCGRQAVRCAVCTVITNHCHFRLNTLCIHAGSTPRTPHTRLTFVSLIPSPLSPVTTKTSFQETR